MFKNFRLQYLGKKIDFDGVYGGQCVDLFLQYNKEVVNNITPLPVVGAKDYWSNYDRDPALKNAYTKISNSATNVPEEGCVLIFKDMPNNPFGHVSIFIEGTDMIFTSFDQNWPTLNKCTVTEHNYDYLLGWFRPKNLPEELTLIDTNIESKIEKDLKLKEVSRYNNQWSYKDLIEDWKTLTKQYYETKKNYDKVVTLNTELINKNKSLSNAIKDSIDVLSNVVEAMKGNIV